MLLLLGFSGCSISSRLGQKVLRLDVMLLNQLIPFNLAVLVGNRLFKAVSFLLGTVEASDFVALHRHGFA